MNDFPRWIKEQCKENEENLKTLKKVIEVVRAGNEEFLAQGIENEGIDIAIKEFDELVEEIEGEQSNT